MEIFMSNLWIIAPAMWACFITYAVWFSTRAKRFAPLTMTEAKQLWAIHRQNVKCGSKRWRQIRDHGRTVGFECGCGHKHMQKRPIVAGSPAASMSMTTTFNTTRSSRRSSWEQWTWRIEIRSSSRWLHLEVIGTSTKSVLGFFHKIHEFLPSKNFSLVYSRTLISVRKKIRVSWFRFQLERVEPADERSEGIYCTRIFV